MMRGFSILLDKELREQWRSRRLPMVLGVFAGLGILSPLLARFTPDIVASMAGAQLAAAMPVPQAADAVDQFLKNVGQFGALAAILLAMGAVATEKDRGVAAFVLSKPASRAAYLSAKIVALGALVAAGVAVAGLLTYVYTALLFQPLPPVGFVAACALVWLILVVDLAVTFLGSTVAPSAMVAAGIGFAWLVATGIASALPGIGHAVPVALTMPARGLATGAGAGDVAVPLLVAAAAVAGCLVLAWRLFERQEV